MYLKTFKYIYDDGNFQWREMVRNDESISNIMQQQTFIKNRYGGWLHKCRWEEVKQKITHNEAKGMLFKFTFEADTTQI